MSKPKDRREFLRDATVITLGGAAAGYGFTKEALAQVKAFAVNPEAKAVMPDGRLVTRADLMRQLGLNPMTPADAWLNIVNCGSNAAALTIQQRENLLKRGMKFEGMELQKMVPGRTK